MISYFPLSRECATNLLRTCPSEATFPKLAHFPWQGHTVDEGVRRGTRNNNDTRIEGNWESRWTAGVIRDARLTAKFRDLIKSRRTLANAPREREREKKGKAKLLLLAGPKVPEPRPLLWWCAFCPRSRTRACNARIYKDYIVLEWPEVTQRLRDR